MFLIPNNRVYFAGSFLRKKELQGYAQQLVELYPDVIISSRWLSQPDDPVGTCDWEWALEDLYDLENSDTLIVFTGTDNNGQIITTSGGHHVEFGYALRCKTVKCIIIVGPNENIFHKLYRAPEHSCKIFRVKDWNSLKGTSFWMDGGTKDDSDKIRYDLLPWDAIDEMCKVMTYGASKYGEDNWRKGLNNNRLIAALLRHIRAHMSGEFLDPETECSHLAHAMSNIGMMFELMNKDNKELENETF